MKNTGQEIINALRTQLQEKDTKIEQLIALHEQLQEEVDALREPSIDSFNDL